jgi:uncharacterized protein YndB with AHSA1/START domain
MSTERRLARSEFSLTRDFTAPIERVWNAFAIEEERLGWWGAGAAMEPREWAFDFRIGGTDVAEGKFHNGPVSRYVATYTDIVEALRIVTTYDMWIDGVHMSTSVASLEFEGTPDGTRYTHAEHGVFFDQFWDDGAQRESGTRGIMGQLGRYLAE